MLETIFRGKRVADDTWIEGSLIKVDVEQQRFYLIFGAGFAWALNGRLTSLEHAHVDSRTVGQYIGKTDKKGRKIFTGDIVEFEYFTRKYRGEVVFNENTCGFEIQYKTGIAISAAIKAMHKINFSAPDNVEVIGNRFDNLELIS